MEGRCAASRTLFLWWTKVTGASSNPQSRAAASSSNSPPSLAAALQREAGLTLTDKSHEGDYAKYENEDSYYFHTPYKLQFVSALILFYPGPP